MPESPSANMALILPSENSDAGTWDQYINDAFGLVDSHNHTTGQGARVPTAGLNINADLAFSSGGSFFAAKDLKAVDFQPQAAAGMTAYAGALFVNSSDSNNLYFRTQSGTNVRITNGTSLDITSSGGIAGDYIAVSAEVAFSDANKEYTFKQDGSPKPWAALRSGPLRIAELDTNESVYVEVIAPAALAGSYTITLPTAAPAAFNPVTMTTGGVLSVLTTNEHVTVSGTGQFKHPSRQRTVSSLAFRVLSGTPTVTAANGTITGVCTLAAEIHLESTKRLLSMAWGVARQGAGTITAEVFRSVAGAAGASISTTTINSGTTFAVNASAAINETLTATNQYWLIVTMDNAANIFHYAGILFDEP